MPSTTEALLENAERLPSIPHVMHDVVRSMQDDNVTFSAIADLVRNDVAISANVLRLANSSYYGSRRKVSNITDAITLIGLNAFRNRVIATALATTFPQASGVDLSDFWRGSMLVGNLAHIIGQPLGRDRELLFSAGLLHEIGKLLIYFFATERSAVLEKATSGAPLAEIRAIESGLLDTNHFELGEDLARRWAFPESIQAAIGNYDAPDGENFVGRVVHVSRIIATGIMNGDPIRDMAATIPEDMRDQLKVDLSWFEEQGEVFDALLDESAELVRGANCDRY